MKSKVKKIIIVGAIAIVVLTSGLLYFLNLNNNYKPNGKIEYENVYIKEETNPYYQIGYADYVFVGKVIKENERFMTDFGSPRTTYQITVIDNLKGNLQEDIEVIYPGGYNSEGTLILSRGDYIVDESLLDINETYIFVGIGQSRGGILLQSLYTDTPYSEENKEKFMDYINNSEEVTRDRFHSKYEKQLTLKK